MSRACYLISYDIPSDKRRTKIMHLLEGYGERVQYSVFEVWLDDGQRDELRQRLERLMEPPSSQAMEATTDSATAQVIGSVRIYALCRACQQRREVLGTGEPTAVSDVVVV